MRNTADVTGGKPIAILLQSISGVNAINPLVAFYDIHGRKREVLLFYFVTTREIRIEPPLKRIKNCSKDFPKKNSKSNGLLIVTIS
jgi:hypothetical protein